MRGINFSLHKTILTHALTWNPFWFESLQTLTCCALGGQPEFLLFPPIPIKASRSFQPRQWFFFLHLIELLAQWMDIFSSITASLVTVERVLLWVFSLMALEGHHNRLELFLHADVNGTCIDLFFGGGLLSLIFFFFFFFGGGGLLGTSTKVSTAQCLNLFFFQLWIHELRQCSKWLAQRRLFLCNWSVFF